MKPEYIKVMQREIHSANVLMGRQKRRGYSNFIIYAWCVCPQFRLSEKVDETIESRYELARIINGISAAERKTDPYVYAYEDFMTDWLLNPDNEGDLPPTPEEWKIREQVQ